MRTLLQNGRYRRLFAAQCLALGGTGVATVALGLLAHDLAGPDAAAVLGTALGIKMVAYVVVSPVVGAVATRTSRRALMVGADLVRVGVVLVLPWVDGIGQVFVLIAVLQAASATFTPVFQSVLPDVLPDEREYTAALSASQFAVSVENVASPLLAAVALLVVDSSSLFAFTATGFLASALLVARTSVPAAAACTCPAPFGARVTSGVRILATTPRLRAVLALNAVVASTGVITLVTTVNVARDLLGGTATDVALLLAAAGAGTAGAAIAVPWLLARLGEGPVMGAGAGLAVAAVGAAVALSRAPSWAAAVAVWVVIGASTALISVPVGRLIRAAAAPGDRAVVFAAQFSLSHACWLVTYPLTGVLVAAGGFTVGWGVLAVLAAGAALVARRCWLGGARVGPTPRRVDPWRTVRTDC